MRLPKTIHKASSPFGSYKVVDRMYEGRSARLLYGKDNTPQSGMALDDEPELLFDYNQRMLELLEGRSIQRVLVIGGGVMMLPKAIRQRHPETIVDTVEIDEVMVSIAKEFFDAVVDERFKVHVSDGLDFIANTPHSYDAVLIDAFDGFEVPEHLLSEDMLKSCHAKLRSDGFVAYNIISDFIKDENHPARLLHRANTEIFSEEGLYQSDPDHTRNDEQNLIYVFSNARLDFAYLQSHNVIDDLAA